MSVKADVDRGLEIKRQIELLKRELEAIQSRLEAAALDGEQVDLKDQDRDGKAFMAQGSEVVVPVILTADLLASSFADGSKQHMTLAQIAGEKLELFFKRPRKWESQFESGKLFRQAALSELGEAAGKFIEACLSRDKHGIPKSKIVVDWKNAF